MRVFLTGASGFIGSFLAGLLVDRCHEVAVLLRPDASPWRIADKLDSLRTIVGDLDQIDAIARELADFAPEVVIHAAWSGVASRDRNDVRQTVNIERSARLLSQCIKAGAKSFVGFGSQAEYGANAINPDEWSTLRPTTMYGATKAAAFHVLRAICDRHDVRFSWARVFSTYGPKDSVDWMIPQLTLSLLRGRRPALTKGTQQWDYCHASDVARAVIYIAETRDAHGPFNIGAGMTHSIRHIVELVRDIVAPGASLGFGEVPYRSEQVMHLQANVTRIRDATGWRPEISIEDGLRETVEWYRAQRGSLW